MDKDALMEATDSGDSAAGASIFDSDGTVDELMALPPSAKRSRADMFKISISERVSKSIKARARGIEWSTISAEIAGYFESDIDGQVKRLLWLSIIVNLVCVAAKHALRWGDPDGPVRPRRTGMQSPPRPESR